ncbi:MAG: flagellar export protein FliJ [Planctomycetia bacterium]|nr:flagellar export protein FliJ [Planctomycetia bacterium]
MKRFEFRLESLLNLRRAAEESAKRAFGEVRTAADRQRDEAERAAEAEARAKDEMRSAQSGLELCVADLLAHQRHVAALGKRAGTERSRLGDLEAALEKARGALAAAMKDRKVLDRLRERRAAEWQAEMLKDEQRAADEASSAARQAGGAR